MGPDIELARERGWLFVSIPFVQPGARVLWCLKRRLSDIHCVMYAEGLPVEVQIFQDRDILMREIFPEERLAVGWARLYGDRLKQQGWQEVPTGKNRPSDLRT